VLCRAAKELPGAAKAGRSLIGLYARSALKCSLSGHEKLALVPKSRLQLKHCIGIVSGSRRSSGARRRPAQVAMSPLGASAKWKNLAGMPASWFNRIHGAARPVSITCHCANRDAYCRERAITQGGSWTPDGGAPDFVEVGEAGIAVDNAMRRQRRVQLVG
jgi:hypothetical protein